LTPIHWDSAGSRPLVCKYHGWSFDSEGKLRRIPFEKEVYRYTDLEKKKLCLKRFKVELVGRLIFVNVSDDPLPIEKQIVPDLLRQLREISGSFDSSYAKQVSRRKFNWKLVYENLRDGLHVPFVHPKTLSNLIEYDVSKIPVRIDWSMSLGALSHGGADAPIPNLPAEDWHSNVDRWPCGSFYHNWLIYPNLHLLTATCGNSFSIEYHEPVSPGETDVHLYFVTAKRKNPSWDPTEVLNGHFQGADVILSEDYGVLEKLQENLARASLAPALGAYEWWNFRIESWYLRAIGRARVEDYITQYLGWPLRVIAATLNYGKKHGWKPLFKKVLRFG
jgi:phenylpropionate dioxygenase-like ring-hydroxylating dioxygenase large terminal subunit